MNRTLRLAVAAALLGSTSAATAFEDGEWSGWVAVENLGFFNDSDINRQHRNYLSFAAEPEYYLEWNGGDDAFTFTPFVRVDQHDDQRSHWDVREFNWVHVGDDWEIRAGIGKVFWGVTEAVHLVDIVNQTDLVENEDGEDKLGQPMIDLTLIRDWGIVDLFVLPGFRERTFQGKEGRPRTNPYIDENDAIYDSGSEQNHIDLAARWSHYIGAWDVGIAHFWGTSREPRLQPKVRVGPGFPPSVTVTKLQPVYDIIHQTSIDVQATLGDWLWKFEGIYRTGQGDRFFAMAGGYEYTFVGIFGTHQDMGIITEYLWDERGDEVDEFPSNASPFQKDVVLGARWTLNDANSTEILASSIIDLEGDGYSYNIEASRRFGDNWKLSAEIRGLKDQSGDSFLNNLRSDDRARVEMAYHF